MDKLTDRPVYVKEGVLLRPEHFLFLPVGLIIKAFAVCSPSEYPIWITRGAENCPGSAPTSKHLIGCAFDFRTRHFIRTVDRDEIVLKMQAGLGAQYYIYYKKNSMAEWIHAQYNGGL